MAKIYVTLLTDYRSSEINTVDVLLIDTKDTSKNQFTILSDFPDGLDLLTSPVTLTAFGNLSEHQDYWLILRIFLNTPPYNVKSRNHIITFRDTTVTAGVIVRR